VDDSYLLSLCRCKIFEKTGGHCFFQKLFIFVYNENVLLVGNPGETRTGFVQLPLVGEALTGGCSSYYVLLLLLQANVMGNELL